jgi:hypothetical protein
LSALALLRIKHLTHTPDGRKLTPSEKGVLMQIADDHNEDRGYAWPSIPKLAMRVGLSDSQCRRLIRGLERENVVESRARLRDDNEGRLANDYRFWFDKPFDAASTAKTDKRLRLQAAQRAGRPTQMKLAPPGVDAGGALPSMGGGYGHGSQGDPGMDAGGSLPSVQGQATPVQQPNLLRNTPLPPVPGREADLILPIANCRRGDPGFAHGLGLAARWVMARRGISNGRLEPMIAGALMQRCEMQGETLEQVVWLAANNGAAYDEALAGGLLRFGPWGPTKFWGEGYWQNADLWPWKDEVREQLQDAKVARTAPPPIESQPADAMPDGLDVERGRELWLQLLGEAAKEINVQSFETWLKPLRSLGVCEGVLYVKMPSRAFQYAVERYVDVLQKFFPPGLTAVKSLYLGAQGGKHSGT